MIEVAKRRRTVRRRFNAAAVRRVMAFHESEAAGSDTVRRRFATLSNITLFPRG